MITILALAATLARTNAACSGPTPAIASVTPRLASDDGGVDTYALHVVVTNRSAFAQRSNVLQSVAVFQDGGKVNQKGIPPLAAHGSYAFDQTFQRSDQARAHTTQIVLRLRPDANAATSCYGDGARFRLTV